MDDREREIYQDKIVIGELAKTFLREPLADHLLKQAHGEIEIALDEFLDLDPRDAKAVTQLQVRVKVALAALQWMNEAVIEGAKALDEYVQRKETDKEQMEDES